MSPDETRDETIQAVLDVGGTVLSTEPLAHPETPHEVAAWRITAGALDPAVLAALAAVQADTEVQIRGLVPWEPEEVEDASALDDA
ncbi:hypothetical protein [Microbacterium gubbeenense]|uniref:hypothetical protein n=1 Tax=Microbacterium gubbeenense TaxID=159896 RepID=UPI003F9937C1